MFCEVCESVLNRDTSSGLLLFVCGRCGKTKKSNDVDSLIYYESFNKNDENTRHGGVLNNAAYDNINPRVFKPCPRCKKEIVSYIITDVDMVYMYKCTCGHQF